MNASQTERMPKTAPRPIPEHMAPQKGEVRLFRNPVLERLSKISPVTVLSIYAPVIVLFAWRSFNVGVPALTFIAVFLYGLASWTLFEYLFHRWVFHFTPRGEFQKRVSFLFHGVHHQYPNDKKRLVMPVALSLAIGIVLFALTSLIFGDFVWANAAGFTTGYLAYDMMHYSIHHFRHPQVGWLKTLWKSHLDHHFRDSSKGYGVSSPMWDVVFGTLRVSKQ